jgi:O-antigen/teichoic acid export membrane protein
VHSIIRGVKNSTFLRHNLIFLVGSIAVGALNYLFYPVLGRLLGPSSFGEVQVLISLFLQLTIFLTVLSLVTVNITANYRDKSSRNEVVYELEKVALIISLFVFFSTFILGEPIKQFLNFDSSWPFVLLALALVITVPFTFRSSYLRGQQQFGKTSLANLISAGGKFGLATLLVVMGLGTNGAILGLVLAQILAFGYARRQARLSGLIRPAGSTRLGFPKLHLIAPELRYSLFVFIGSLAIMLLFSIDVIIVKHFFDAHTAGLYAGIATVARIVFFVTASVAQVMLPAVKFGQSEIKNRQLLIKSTVLLSALSLPIILVLTFFPQQIVGVLMGAEYLPYASLLPQLSIAIFVISLLNLLVSYYLALRRYIPSIIAMIGTIIVLTFMITQHNSLEAIVSTLFYGTIVIACVIIFVAFYQKPNRGNE